MGAMQLHCPLILDKKRFWDSSFGKYIVGHVMIWFVYWVVFNLKLQEQPSIVCQSYKIKVLPLQSLYLTLSGLCLKKKRITIFATSVCLPCFNVWFLPFCNLVWSIWSSIRMKNNLGNGTRLEEIWSFVTKWRSMRGSHQTPPQ